MSDTPELLTFSLEDASGASHQYQTVLLPARKGIPLSMRLMKALGGPLFALAGSEGDEVDFMAVAPALRDLDPEDLADMAVTLLSTTTRDGKLLADRTFDKAYSGNYEEMYRAVWEVVRLNRMIPLLDTLSPATTG